MAQLTKIIGMPAWLKRLEQNKKQAAFGMQRGLKRAGLLIQRESMKIVPVETGHLKAGAFTRAEGKGMQTVVMVGYVADYAIYVHEDLNALHGEAYNQHYFGPGRDEAGRFTSEGGLGETYRVHRSDPDGEVLYVLKRHKRGPNQQAKFLTVPFLQNQTKIRAIIEESVTDALH